MADFLRLIDVNAGGFRLKKGQGILHLTDSLLATRQICLQQKKHVDHKMRVFRG